MCHTNAEPVSHISRPQRSGGFLWHEKEHKDPFQVAEGFPGATAVLPVPALMARTCCLPQPQSPLSLSEGLLLTGEPWHLSMQCHHLPCWGLTPTICFFCHQSAAAKQRQRVPMQSCEIFNISMLHLGQAAFLTKARCQGNQTGTGAFLCAPRVHTNAVSSIPCHGSGQQRAAGHRSQC